MTEELETTGATSSSRTVTISTPTPNVYRPEDFPVTNQQCQSTEARKYHILWTCWPGVHLRIDLPPSLSWLLKAPGCTLAESFFRQPCNARTQSMCIMYHMWCPQAQANRQRIIILCLCLFCAHVKGNIHIYLFIIESYTECNTNT